MMLVNRLLRVEKMMMSHFLLRAIRRQDAYVFDLCY